MKTAFLTTTFNNTTNGPAKFARLLYEDSILKEKNIIFFTEDVSEENQSIVRVKIPKWLDIPGIGFLYRLFRYYFTVMKHGNIDVVVCNNMMYCFLFNLLTKKKTVGFINDNEHLKKLKSINYLSIRSFIFSLFEKFNLNRNTKTIVNSNFLKNEIEKHFDKKYTNLEVLYKGIEINAVLDIKKHYDDKIFQILFVKTNYKIGGLLTLLKAVENIDNIQLDIVTSERIINDPAFNDLFTENMIFHHKLKQEEVFRLMKKAHCLCIPSNKEALGVANMEGMLYSCAIISTNVGGIPEVLDFGNNGIMINPNNYLSLRDNIEFLKNNRNLRIEMVKKGYGFVKNFSIKNTLNSFYQLTNA